MIPVYSPYFIVKRLQEEMFRRYAVYLSGRVFDVGCGTQPYRQFLYGASRYIGMDEDGKVLPHVVGNVQKIPFRDSSFDGLVCTEVLEHVLEPGAALQEMHRVLKENGYLYVTVPQNWGLHYEPRDYWRFTKYGIAYLLTKNKLRIVEIKKIGGACSVITQWLIDIIWEKVARVFSFLGRSRAERIASSLCILPTLCFFFLGKAADSIDVRYGIGWSVLARK